MPILIRVAPWGWAAAVLLLLAGTAAADLVNGSFEEWKDGQPVGWKVSAPATVSQDREQPLAGAASLLIAFGPGRGAVELVQAVPTPADSARVYQLVLSFREEPGMVFLADIRYFGADGKPFDRPLFDWRQPAPAWTERIVKILPPPGAAAMTVRLYAAGTGKVWVDAMTFQDAGLRPALPPDPRQLAHNPGFEDYAEDERFGATLTDGVWRPNAPIRVTVVRDPAKAHAGKNCIFAEQESEGQGAFYQSGLPVDFLRQYQVMFWARGDGDLQVLVYQFPLPTVSAGTKIELTADWREYKVAYRPTSSLVNRASLAFHFAGELWLDDVAFREGP